MKRGMPASTSASREICAASTVGARSFAALVCAVVVPCSALAPAAMAGTATSGTATASTTQPASATLEQCATATIPQTERSATFAGEMTAFAGTVRMEIRIDLQERGLEETLYHTVSAPGLGVWHSSTPGVKVFTHLQQVTNLSAPAFYRGAVRFRWVGAKGRLIKTEELRTARCEQPAPAAAAPTTGADASSITGAGGVTSA
jgi:hypothetical protein